MPIEKAAIRPLKLGGTHACVAFGVMRSGSRPNPEQIDKGAREVFLKFSQRVRPPSKVP
jgi:hypothetical protein